MKRKILLTALLGSMAFVACKKNNSDASNLSLTASTTTASVGQTVTVTLSSNTNAARWSVTPAATASQAYTVSTSKVNYFAFNAPGVYTVSVRARSVAYDSTSHQSLDSCWNHAGADRGNCTKGQDSASVSITVAK